ncbi:Lrp/AsnC family transcriptional regulator [Neolewinella antarctica]|uniref:DNA-binding Lrp family transcriptional regulator n=1 Tax=Neolewinella antarctica TaxID=442734 RepID=A0ABX0XD96_9BACT|nr:Lrp/AsnC family transcriptional regulator [Neolewinella antarctica]NJC26901.1 DNA-binding Lrp family transcriptional regulator [Neolewinella antarctica]
MQDLLDDTDLTILRILQQDSKKTAKEIAAHLDLTPSPIYERIRRLERAGYIAAYVALLDKKLFPQLAVTAFCQVSMRYHDSNYIEKFEAQVRELEEVQECFHMAGKVDFILKVNSASLDDYHDFIRYKLSAIENIGELNSSFVLKEIKRTTALNV